MEGINLAKARESGLSSSSSELARENIMEEDKCEHDYRTLETGIVIHNGEMYVTNICVKCNKIKQMKVTITTTGSAKVL